MIERRSGKERRSVNPPYSRFVVKENPNGGSWYIHDNETGRWNMPEKAVSLYLRREAATKICEILNREWAAFNNNPS